MVRPIYSEVCGKCGLKYADLKTGYTFREVWELLWVNSENPADWKYKRRGSVLRLWHSLKVEMWEEHLANCKKEVVISNSLEKVDY
jgi:hypothetical protein